MKSLVCNVQRLHSHTQCARLWTCIAVTRNTQKLKKTSIYSRRQ